MLQITRRARFSNEPAGCARDRISALQFYAQRYADQVSCPGELASTIPLGRWKLYHESVNLNVINNILFLFLAYEIINML